MCPNIIRSPDITFALSYKAGKFMRLVRDINFILQERVAPHPPLCSPLRGFIVLV